MSLTLDIPGVVMAQTELQLEELLELQYLRHPVSYRFPFLYLSSTSLTYRKETIDLARTS